MTTFAQENIWNDLPVFNLNNDLCGSVAHEPTVGADASAVLKSAGHVIASPAHWRSSDYVKAGTFVLISSIAFSLENDVRTIYTQ